MDNKQEKLKKKAQKLIDNNGNEYLAQLDATLEIGDKLDDLTEAIKDFQTPEPPEVEVNLDKTDTLLQDILAELKKKDEEEITYSISPSDQEKLRGEDGYTPQKGVDYFDGKDGQNGENGKDGSPDTREDIIKKINEGGVLKIKASEITGLPDFTREVVREVGMGFVETPIKAGSGIAISKDASGANVISATASGGGGTWGSITGTLSDQTDLQTALNAKQNTITTGTTAQYFRGDLSLATFPTDNTSFTNGAGYLTSSTGANTALSNLASVAINTSLLLGADGTIDIGNTTNRLNDIHLSSGSIFNWVNGDILLTHSSNLLTLTGGNMNVSGTLSSDVLGYNSMRAVFGERLTNINELQDALWKADRRFTVTSTWGGDDLSTLFKGGFENTYIISPSVTDVININFTNQSGVGASGITYPEGKFYVHFYYINNNYSAISARVKQNGTWYALATPTDISITSGDKVLEFSVPNNNYMTDIELTVTTNGTDSVYITALNYISNRWTTELDVPYFDKFAENNNLLGTITLKDSSQHTTGVISATGDTYFGVTSGGKVGIGTATPGAYHLNVVGNILGNDIVTNSGSVFRSLGHTYLRANGTSGIHIGDSASQAIDLGVGGGAVGVNTNAVVSGTKLQVNAGSGTASSIILKLYGSQTGFSGSNDVGTAYAMTFDACSYQTSIKQSVGAKIEMAKENTWNYADSAIGIKGSLKFYTSAGTPDSPTLTNWMTLTSAGNLGLGSAITPLTKLDARYDANINTTTPGTTAYGTIHLVPTTGTDGYSTGISFGSNNSSSVNTGSQAGIYVQGSSAYGTRMHFATSNNFGTGATVRMSISEGGDITMTGSLGITGTRVSKGWFTNLESTNMPTVGGTAILTSLTAPQFTTIELGHATDTTISRSSAGVIAVEGVVIPSISSTNTLTNKRITPRVGSTTSSATPTIDTDSYDAYSITALATDITSMTTNLSGTPTNFQKLIIRIKDDGTARAITWGASFEAKGVALPTTTVISKVLTVGFIYDTVTSKWGCVASAQEV